MKRFIIGLLFSFVVVISFNSCGEGSSSQNTSISATTSNLVEIIGAVKSLTINILQSS